MDDKQLYVYRAKVLSVYDGDTIHVDIDLGLSTWIKNEKLRLARINAPELKGDERPAGLLARDFLREKIADKEILIETVKDKKGKYGRYIAELWLKNSTETYENINDLMVTSGHAEYKEY